MADSVLDSVKTALGLPLGDTSFDAELTLHINSVFSDLNQLGVGPLEGFSIGDKTSTWDEFIGTDTRMNNVKTYMYLRVKMLFDPPITSFALDAMDKQIQKLEWRINVAIEDTSLPIVDVTPTTT